MAKGRTAFLAIARRAFVFLAVVLVVSFGDASNRGVPVGRLHLAFTDAERSNWSGDGSRPLAAHAYCMHAWRMEIEFESFLREKPADTRQENTMRNEYDFSKGKRGPAIESPGKTRITIMLDNDIIEAFRQRAEARGMGYQTAINEALRAALDGENAPLTAGKLREIIRQELHPAD